MNLTELSFCSDLVLVDVLSTLCCCGGFVVVVVVFLNKFMHRYP